MRTFSRHVPRRGNVGKTTAWARRANSRAAGEAPHLAGPAGARMAPVAIWTRCTRVGGSCSMHNPWLVVPHPRGVGRLGVGAGRQPSVHSADINEPAAETASEDRWNTAVSSRCTTPVRLQCQHHGHRRPAGRMRRASAKPSRLARSILRSRGRGLKALCCLLTSETFGGHDF